MDLSINQSSSKRNDRNGQLFKTYITVDGGALLYELEHNNIYQSSSRRVGREFASRPGHTKDHHKNGTNCLPEWACMR